MDFNADTDLDASSTLDFNTDIDFDKNYDLDLDIDVDVDIDSNVASLTFDVLATADDGSADTLAEADVFVLAVEDTLSQVGGSMVAAVD